MNKKNFICLFIVIIVFCLGILIFTNLNNDNKNNEKQEEQTELTSQEELNESTQNLAKEQDEENTIQNNENQASTESTNESNSSNEDEKNVITQISPSGFMGSSLYKVVLYSNGDVYLQTYDGNGYDEANIVSSEQIAKGVTSIERQEDDEHYGEISIQGGELINNNFGWINQN